MAVIFIEGFDKYRKIAAGIFGGDWNTSIGNTVSDGTGGGSASSFGTGIYQGDAFRCGQDAGLFKNLPANYSTIIWGCRFKVQSAFINAFAVIVGDGGNNQVTVRVNNTGAFEIRRGSEGGAVFGIQGSTLIDTSAASISINQWHYLEAKITIDSTVGAYEVYLDTVLIMSGTGVNTQATGNAYVNSFSFKAVDFTSDTLVDDMYIFDTTTAFNNDVVGDSVVETQFPASDHAVQFTVGEAAFGVYYSYTGASIGTGSNVIVLRPFIPTENCTINSISIRPQQTNLTAKYKMVIYNDNSNSPHTLLSSGTEVVGTAADVVLTGNLVTPQSLTGGSRYWLGFITDTNVNLYREGIALSGFNANNTYGSGAPTPDPSMSAGQSDYIIWGNVTTTFNFTEVNQSPLSSPLVNYVTNTSVGDEDQYNFPVMSFVPLHVFAVKVSAYCSKSDAGARFVDLRVVSGATDDGGDKTSQSVTPSFQFLSSHWNSDPNTGLAWAYATVNNATSGIKVVS